jgi:hypothetical protein
MPAVELTRLKKQADELADCFYQPVEFKRLLLDRLEFYADRVTRPGNMAKPAPLIPHFGVPDLFMQAVEQVLQKPSAENPNAALQLVEMLWTDPHLEPRLLAAALIGMAARNNPDAAASLLVQYCVPQENPLVQEALLQRSGLQLRAANLQVWFDLVERWISSETLAQQLIGFKALQGVIDDRSFENLPVVYRLLTIPLETTNRATHHDLETLIILLARRSPVETAYFLRQCYTRAGNPILSRLVRKVLPAFSTEGQATLRRALQDQSIAVNNP